MQVRCKGYTAHVLDRVEARVPWDLLALIFVIKIPKFEIIVISMLRIVNEYACNRYVTSMKQKYTTSYLSEHILDFPTISM